MNKEFEKFIEQTEKTNESKRKICFWGRKELDEFCDGYFTNDTEVENYCQNIYRQTRIIRTIIITAVLS
jgi:hypothetical protein